MTPNEFRWNVAANLAAALIVFIVGAGFYLLHERRRNL